jgi:hypothetical protein
VCGALHEELLVVVVLVVLALSTSEARPSRERIPRGASPSLVFFNGDRAFGDRDAPEELDARRVAYDLAHTRKERRRRTQG